MDIQPFVPPSDQSPKKRKRARKATPAAVPQDVEIIVEGDGDAAPQIDPATGYIEIHHPDGSVTIDTDPSTDAKDTKHDDNLAEHLSDAELNRIADQLLEGIEADIEGRAEWLNTRAQGIDLLGLKMEPPRGGVGQSSAPMEGMSTVRDPLLKEAVLRFQANSRAELLPASGPVKTVIFGDETPETDQLAEALEKDLNFYLTTTASEYYPDTDRMLFWTGFASGMFKKVYKCPLRRRPVSESVDGSNLIVPSNATDLRNAGRVTHEIDMRQSVMRRMQILGVYRDVPLTPPNNDPNPVDQKVAETQGMNPKPQREADQEFTVYECYCELDIPGFEHRDNGKITGLPIPYRVTIDRDSRTILEIRRNFDEDDPDCQAKIPFVLFPYCTGIGLYGIGLLHILGDITRAVTALVREGIDAGMFANFPGFLYSKSGVGRQITNEFRIPPGGGVGLDTGNMPINQAVMPLPYKGMDAATVALLGQLRDVGQRVGGTAEAPVGEGKQDAPVGTTLAMIEQATKIEASVHKRLHAAQAEEFNLLIDLFKDDPEALWRGNRRPALGPDAATRIAKFKAALDRVDIVPMADPNVPSHTHRLMKALSIKQLQAANPALYNPVAVDTLILSMIHVDNPTALFNPPQPAGPPQPDPAVMAKLADLQVKQGANQVKAQSNQIALQKAMLDAHGKSQERKSKENIAVLNVAKELAVHPESNAVVNDQLDQMAPFMHPVTGQPMMPPETIQ